MLYLIKTVFGSTDADYGVAIDHVIGDAGTYLNPQEKKVFLFLKNGWDTFTQFPTEDLFIRTFPEYKISLSQTDPLDKESFDYHKREYIENKKRLFIAKDLTNLANKVTVSGLTSDMVEELRGYIKDNKAAEPIDSISSREIYNSMKSSRKDGIYTYIPELDQLIGTIYPGTLTTISGFTGHGKTTLALSIAYKAARDGKNVVYISLEVPGEELRCDLVSLHSTLPKFGSRPIPRRDILYMEMDPSQEELYYKVADDFDATILPNFHILTERDFTDFSFGEIRDILYKEDAKKKIDVLIVDQASLCKYYSKGKYSYTGDAINEYCSFFRRLAICFKIEDGVDRHLTIILLSQINRSGYSSAAKEFKKRDPAMEGKYDETAIAEAHELARSSSYVITFYASPEMILSKEARVCLLKNRHGKRHEDPITVNFDPDFCQVGEMERTSSPTSNVNNFSSVSSFDSFMKIKPTELGFSLSHVDFSDL